MKKVLVFSDLHFGNKSNQSRYLDTVKDVINKAIEICEEKSVDTIIMLGDYWENRNTINVKTLNRGFQALEKLSKIGLDIYILEGNHDYYYRTTKQYSSTEPLASVNTNIKIINKITPLEIEGIQTLLVPWLMPSDINEFNKYKPKKFDVAFGHFEIQGFELNMSGFINKTGLEVQDFNCFKKVFSGHFHKRQKIGNIKYVGSPYQIDFGESGDIKGFTILSFPSLKEEFIENTFSPKYVKVFYSQKEKYKTKNIKNNIVKPTVDVDVPEENILEWESILKSYEPTELLPSIYNLPESSTEDVTADDIPSDPLSLMFVYLETLKPPEDIKKGTLRKVIRGLFDETQKSELLTKKNNQLFIDKVRFRNLYSFGKRMQEVETKKGINLVMGPNGSGKSAMLESFVLGFYGKPIRSVKRESVVNKINETNCEIEIEFHNNHGDRLKIQRSIKPQFLKYYKNDILQPQESKIVIYQNNLNKNILSCDYQIFSNLQFISLARSTPFLSMGTNDKRRFLEHLMDLTIFQHLYSVIQNKLKQFDKKVAIFERERDIYKESIQENKNHYNNLKTTFNQLKEGKDEQVEKINISLERAESNLVNSKEKLKRRIEQIQKLETEKLELIQRSRKYNEKIIKCQTKFEENHEHLEETTGSDKCPWCFRTIKKVEIKEKIKQTLITKMEHYTEHIDKYEERKKRIDDKVAELCEKLEIKKEQKSKNNEDIGILRDRINILINQFDDLNKYSIEELKNQINDIKQSTNQTIEKLKRTQEQLKLFRKYVRYFKYIRILIGDDQVKKFAIGKIRPWLNKLANDYLNKIGTNYQIYFDENLDEHFKQRKRLDFEYGNFSGGEQRRLDLVLIFVFQDILWKLRGFYCDLMVVDEFLDSNLDTEGKKMLLDIIKARQKQKNLKVYIVTHSSDVTAESFTGFYEIEKEDMFSKIKEGEFVNA